jgi:3-deoxy-D-manno-octulosonate 8-phosphate phosphatase KdsC-like HAD superfamily phosphatase
MKLVGFTVAPFDATDAVFRIARYVTRAKGGEGVVREMALTLFHDARP